MNPAGNFNVNVFSRLAKGEEIALPHFGLETVHHVHADDVAQAFEKALAHPSRASGEAFHVVSENAITLRGFAEKVAGWFGQPARLAFQPWDAWAAGWDAADAQATWEHVSRSPSMSIEKASAVLGYRPRYSSLEAVFEALSWLIADGQVDSGEKSQDWHANCPRRTCPRRTCPRRTCPRQRAPDELPQTDEPGTDEPGTDGARRSQAWFGAEGRMGMVYRSWMRNQGFGAKVFDGRPVIGIATTWSELAPCNAHLHRVAEAVKTGRVATGWLPPRVPHVGDGRKPDAAHGHALPQPVWPWRPKS